MRLTYTHYYLGINLPKETKDLYTENYKTLIKEIKGNINREIYHVLGLEESILWKWLSYPKHSQSNAFPIKFNSFELGFNAFPIKLLKAFFTELEQKTYTVHMKTQKIQIAKAIFGKKNGTRRINLPDFRPYY